MDINLYSSYIKLFDKNYYYDMYYFYSLQRKSYVREELVKKVLRSEIRKSK